MKQFISLFFILLFALNHTLSFASDFSLKAKVVSIIGNIQNPVNQSVILEFSDLIRESCRYTSLLDEKGDFQFQFEMYHPHDVIFQHGDKLLQLFLYPGDTLQLQFDGQDFRENANEEFETLIFKGKHQQINETILAYNAFIDPIEFQPKPEGKSVEVYVSEIVTYIQERKEELNRFIKDYKPSETFKKWANQYILYSNANYLVDYLAYAYMNQLAHVEGLFDVEFFPVTISDNIYTASYRAHLFHYNAYHYTTQDYFRTLIQRKEYTQAYTRAFEDIRINEPEGIARAFMFYFLFSSWHQQSPETFQAAWKGFKHHFQEPAITEAIEKKIENNTVEKSFYHTNSSSKAKEMNEYTLLKKGKNTGELTQLTGKLIEDILEIYKGKIIYIDIWATWCGPCMSEIPDIRELVKYYETEDIVFVSLCMSSTMNEWIRVVDNMQIPGEHYFFNQDETNKFKANFQLNGYPTYMLIDKEGTVLDRSAPRPSSGEVLREKINNLLNSK